MPKFSITLDPSQMHIPNNKWVYGKEVPLTTYEDDIRDLASSGSVKDIISAVRRYESAEKRETKRNQHNSTISNVKKVILGTVRIGDYITHKSVVDTLASRWGSTKFISAAVTIVIQDLIKDGTFEATHVDYDMGDGLARQNAYKRIKT